MRRTRHGSGDGEVPRLPRGRWFGGIRSIELIRIGFVATALVILIVLGRPCADGMARFVESFAPPPDAGPEAPARSLHLERLTEEEIRQRFPGGDEEPASPDEEPASPDEEATRDGGAAPPRPDADGAKGRAR
ncbi:MAG TPA: hypothetical protein VKZ63_15970 [Kofleriaceae bacterium]|nr:hypothetical protein [Kofleriaceae bacterium]